MIPVISRFAPSPTGALHFGSLVTAVASWLVARTSGGRWLVRIEDIDPPREVAGSASAILAALNALGLTADAPPMYQSARTVAYTAALERLRAAGHAFPCWCSRHDLAATGGIHRDGHCVGAHHAQHDPAWRLEVPAGVVTFHDQLQGTQRQDVRNAVGDFVLRRADGLWSYQLACVVDDAFQGVTVIVRGADLVDSTPRQILLQRLLGLPTPNYLHVPLAVTADGEKLSKSLGAAAVDTCDPARELRRALRFLRQPEPTASDPSALLAFARDHFDSAPLRGLTKIIAA